MARNQVSSVAFGQVNSSVRTLPGASVSVETDRGTIPALYVSESGSEVLSNPMTADERGQYVFFVDATERSYLITVTLGPISYSWEYYPPDNVASAGLIYQETWVDLLGKTSNLDGAGAEVTNDSGTHDDATATGYDGSTVSNLGRYRWNDAWQRWVRLADQSAAVRGQPFQSVAELEATEIPGLISEVQAIADDGVLQSYIRSDVAADVQSADGAWWALVFLPDLTSGEYLTRDAIVSDIAAGRLDRLPEGRKVSVPGLDWVKMPAGHALYGTDPISDMPGFAPVGAWTFEHFGDMTALDCAGTISVAIEVSQSVGAKLTTLVSEINIATPIKTYATEPSDRLIVDIPVSTRFVVAADFPDGEMVFRFDATVAGTEMAWRGGWIDGRLMPVRAVDTAPDLMRVHGPWSKVDVSGCYFHCNDDRTGAAGDSGLMIWGCENVSITQNTFRGATDAGVYLSADPSTGVGDTAYVEGNRFFECEVAFISKRSWQYQIVTDNYVEDCTYGIQVGGSSDGMYPPGKYGLITNNTLLRVTYPIAARVSDRTVISDNLIDEWGKDSSGTNVEAKGIDIAGSAHCVVSDNILYLSETSHADSIGIAVRGVTEEPSSTLYYAVYNHVHGNNIRNAYTAIEEGANADNNRFGLNTYRGAITPYVYAGANTTPDPTPRYRTPPAASSTGHRGEVNFDGSFVYYCTSPNTWVRTALSTW